MLAVHAAGHPITLAQARVFARRCRWLASDEAGPVPRRSQETDGGLSRRPGSRNRGYLRRTPDGRAGSTGADPAAKGAQGDRRRGSGQAAVEARWAERPRTSRDYPVEALLALREPPTRMPHPPRPAAPGATPPAPRAVALSAGVVRHRPVAVGGTGTRAPLGEGRAWLRQAMCPSGRTRTASRRGGDGPLARRRVRRPGVNGDAVPATAWGRPTASWCSGAASWDHRHPESVDRRAGCERRRANTCRPDTRGRGLLVGGRRPGAVPDPPVTTGGEGVAVAHVEERAGQSTVAGPSDGVHGRPHLLVRRADPRRVTGPALHGAEGRKAGLPPARARGRRASRAGLWASAVAALPVRRLLAG